MWLEASNSETRSLDKEMIWNMVSKEIGNKVFPAKYSFYEKSFSIKSVGYKQNVKPALSSRTFGDIMTLTLKNIYSSHQDFVFEANVGYCCEQGFRTSPHGCEN